MQIHLLGFNRVGFQVRDQLLLRFFALVRYKGEKGNVARQHINYS
jgi:hypothetical protein